MPKLVIAKVEPSDLKSVGSAVEQELYRLSYGDRVWFENGVYHIWGREHIKTFVNNMMALIQECRDVFKDAQSISEFEQDEKFLKELLKIKAE